MLSAVRLHSDTERAASAITTVIRPLVAGEYYLIIIAKLKQSSLKRKKMFYLNAIDLTFI